jgi:hypothetical protein
MNPRFSWSSPDTLPPSQYGIFVDNHTGKSHTVPALPYCDLSESKVRFKGPLLAHIYTSTDFEDVRYKNLLAQTLDRDPYFFIRLTKRLNDTASIAPVLSIETPTRATIKKRTKTKHPHAKQHKQHILH